MKKIGFIDYFLDEWHANNYPAWIKEQSGGECVVTYAYAKIDSPLGGLTSAAWAEKHGVDGYTEASCRAMNDYIPDGSTLLDHFIVKKRKNYPLL